MTGTPTWISYAAITGSTNEFLVSDNGQYNYIFGRNFDLESEFSVPSGTWYHYCFSWSSSTRTQRVYLNGHLIGRESTDSSRNFQTSGYLVIGNDQDGSPGTGMATDNIFGGELYKLNIFSKELSSSEVQDMAINKCSEVEETYGDLRNIKWEDILRKKRSGEISEVATICEHGGKDLDHCINIY